MKFTIENGTNICTIGLSDIGSYIRFNYPLTVVWNDCRGSIGEYFSVLPYNEDYRNTIKNIINDSLNEGNFKTNEELYEILKPLLPIFKNGDYKLFFNHNKEGGCFQYQTTRDNYSKIHTYPLRVIFDNKATNIQDVDNVRAIHKELLKKNKQLDILEHSTNGIFGSDCCFFATQALENIDQSRVKYFEEIIKNGGRSFPLLFTAFFGQGDYESAHFILDGHHKLLAYQNLKIYPPIALITYLPDSIEELEFDAEKLAEVLYPWQIEHILENWEVKDKYIEEALKNPNSILHSFIKNGEIEEFHENGKLKHKAFYINDKVDGCAKYWYDYGQLSTVEYYDKGLRIGNWINYYRSGKVKFIQPFNNHGQYDGSMIAFFENGNKRREEEYQKGRNKDGSTSNFWFENGNKEAELTYRNGQMITRKYWNIFGKLESYELYNEETKKLEKQDLTISEPYNSNTKNLSKSKSQISNNLFEDKIRTKQNTEKSLWNRIKKYFTNSKTRGS